MLILVLRKTTWTLLCSICLLLAMTGYAFAASFSDVQGHWAEKQINKWVDEGLATGYPDGTFKPNQQVSRAEFVALVNRAFNIDKDVALTGFSDVSAGKWYYEDISAAKAAGYIGGYTDGTFKPNQTITRQEVASILVRLLSLTPTDEELEVFADANQISKWARSNVGAVVKNALMKGMPDNTFQPLKSITRAEAVVSLDRAMDFTPGQEPPAVAEEGAIEGKVTMDGKAVDKATVRIFNADSYEVLKETRTDKDGFYKVELDGGQYDITAATDNEVAYESDVKVSEDKVGNADLALEKAAIISGVLKDKNGNLVKNNTVFFTTNPTFVSKTNNKGEFTLAVLPNKTYTVRAYEPGKETAEPVIITSSLDVKAAGRQTVTLPNASFSIKSPGGGGGGGGGSSVAVTGVSLDQSSLSMTVGDSRTLTATVVPTNATNKNVTWTTSDKNVATVDNGVVTAVAGGVAIIEAKTVSGNKTATCVVTVSEVQKITDKAVDDAIKQAQDNIVTIEAPRGAEGVTVSKASLANAVAGTNTLKVQVQDADNVSVLADETSLSSVLSQPDVTNVTIVAKKLSSQETEKVLDVGTPTGIILTADQGAVMFDISIQVTSNGTTSEVRQFDGDITIVLPVPDSLRSAAAAGVLKVYRYDEGWVEIPSSKCTYNSADFTMTVKTDHLCNFLIGYSIQFNAASITVAGTVKPITLTNGLNGTLNLAGAGANDMITAGSVTSNADATLTLTSIKGANGTDRLGLLTAAGLSTRQALKADTPTPLDLIEYLAEELDLQNDGVSVGILRTMFGNSVEINGTLGTSDVKLTITLK